jgi:hypothetical protein
MTPTERGYEAKRLLDNEVLKEALTAIRENLVGKMEASAIGDKDLHHTIALSLQVLSNIKRQLYKFIDTGQYEEAKSKRK